MLRVLCKKRYEQGTVYVITLILGKKMALNYGIFFSIVVLEKGGSVKVSLHYFAFFRTL